jgi:hypothetical protein
MRSNEPLQLSNETKQRLSLDWMTGVLLFAAAAAVVIWQNSRLGILWDLSYILENSYRISAGDVPYRDFPFPYAPLTFLIQAALIKVTGRVFWHHILYCAIVGGLGTVVTWRILIELLSDVLSSFRTIAFLLTLPLVVLGVYCIYPHPFYDPDCTFVILLCIFLLQRMERKDYRPLRTLATGALLVVPLFVKQNTGLAFLVSAVLMIIVLIAIDALRKRPVRGYALLLGGAVVGLALAFVLIHFTVGLANYQRWTIKFAAARRTPSLAEMKEIYHDRKLLLWLGAFAAGALLLWIGRKRFQVLGLAAGVLMCLPFFWSVIYLLIDKDPSERAERLLAVWPFVLIASFGFALLGVWRRSGINLVLPFIVLGAVHGAFLSQQLWGSTYALWPLLMILIGCTLSTLCMLFQESHTNAATSAPTVSSANLAGGSNTPAELPRRGLRTPAVRITLAVKSMTASIALSLLVSGGLYVRSHERLDYANLSDGEMARSKLTPLRGLSMRGSWLPDFEELVSYTEKNIPPENGILMLPGEDLFYYTTGRHPRFPVLMFDHTVNPYSPEEIVEQARARNIQWLIIKEEIQLEEEPIENKDHLIELLRNDFKQIESLNNYEIYRRRTAGDTEEDQDDNDDKDSGDPDN